MSIIKIEDIESVRFSAPDLAEMHKFLLDFGMTDAEDAKDGVLRMRGTGTAPFIHETVSGEPGFVSVSLRAKDALDLQLLAKTEGAEVVKASGPGGGSSIRLMDPDGFIVEVIADKARVETLPDGSRAPWNLAARRDRPGAVKRVAASPANVFRLGHLVLGVSDARASWEWWHARFGFIMSDEVQAPDGNMAAAFIRCDRGGEHVDHHTLNFAAVPGVPPRFHHAAFEVADLDDLMSGSQYLQTSGYHHDWGVGRHILGSQVFDYWRDPWGHRVEHWTDGDLFDASVKPNVTDLATMLGHQWGPSAPANFAV